MGVLDLFRRNHARSTSTDPLAFEDWVSYFDYGGVGYPYGFGIAGPGMPGMLPQTLPGTKEEWPNNSFEGYVRAAYRSNGIVFACMLVRLMLFSEASFQFRQRRAGRPGALFGTSELSILENPWPGATTGDLLARAIQDADLSGNFFVRRHGDRLQRMRPDWTTIILGSHDRPEATADDLDAEVVGYVYTPGGHYSDREPVVLMPQEVAHFAPIPDPSARFRGMSWMTPVIRELVGDNAFSTHKLKFIENAATPNMVVTLDRDILKEQFDTWVEAFESQHKGHLNAYKTLYLGAGSQATVVGKDMRQMDFKEVQQHGETRIAAASGVPAVIVGLSEGMRSATFSNFGQARRRLADGTLRPLWRNFCGSMSQIINVPAGSELWYADDDIAFLHEDEKDAADVLSTKSTAISSLVTAGFDADAVVDAITSGDLTRLQHSGLFSVLLQPPGSGQSPNGSDPTKNAKPPALPAPAE